MRPGTICEGTVYGLELTGGRVHLNVRNASGIWCNLLVAGMSVEEAERRVAELARQRDDWTVDETEITGGALVGAPLENVHKYQLLMESLAAFVDGEGTSRRTGPSPSPISGAALFEFSNAPSAARSP